MDGLPGLFGPVDGPFGWLNALPPLFSVVLVPALVVWLPLLRKRVVVAWSLFAAATLLVVRDGLRFASLPGTSEHLTLERFAISATAWPWLVALTLMVVFRTKRVRPTDTGGRTLVVLIVFAPFLLILLTLAVAPLFA